MCVVRCAFRALAVVNAVDAVDAVNAVEIGPSTCDGVEAVHSGCPLDFVATCAVLEVFVAVNVAAALRFVLSACVRGLFIRACRLVAGGSGSLCAPRRCANP